MASETEQSKRGRNALEVALSVVAKVEPGEGLIAVMMFANIFLILNAYYILKTVREGLIVGGGGMLGLSGAELKIYASAVMAILLLVIVPAYGVLASRVNRIKLINISYLIVIAFLVVFFILGRAGVPLALPYFLWLGIVNVFLIAQFWSYANDIYDEEQGKRLFAIIAIGGSVGAIFGPKIAELGKEYTYGLMVGSGAVLALCLLLFNAINRTIGRAAAARKAAGEEDDSDKPLDKEGGFQLVIKQRYLLLIAVMILIANLVNTTGEFILTNAAVEYAAEVVPEANFEHIADPEARAAAIRTEREEVGNGFYGSFFFWVNLCGFLIQALLVSRIFKYLGVRVALFFLPIIAFGAYAGIGLIGGLALIRIFKIAENSTDYSLQNTVRQALFLPTSREAKYKAKAAIDTFFVRIGDAAAAGLVALGLHTLGFTPRSFAFVNLALVAVWLVICFGIAREHRRISRTEGS